MHKVSMDALNHGLALGFGTQLCRHDADFAQAAARFEATTRTPTFRKPGAFEALRAESAEAASQFVAGLIRRFAH